MIVAHLRMVSPKAIKIIGNILWYSARSTSYWTNNPHCRFLMINVNQTKQLISHHETKYFCFNNSSNKNMTPIVSYQPVRLYAKSRDKKKSDKGHKKKVEVNEDVLAETINVESMRSQINNALDKLKDDYTKNLSLRSTSGSIETIPVTFEGKDYTLQDLAQVVRKNPKTVVINMVSFPQAIPSVLAAMDKSGMNLNPQQDGTSLFIPIPKVTKEHRDMLAKNAKTLFIKCRDSIKDLQTKFIKSIKLKEKNGLAKDTAQLICDYVIFNTNESIAKAEKMMEAKQQELLKET